MIACNATVAHIAAVIHRFTAADWCTDRRGVSVGAVRTNVPIVLTVLADPELSDSIDRVIAAVGLRSVRAQDPSRQSWPTAAAVVVDEDGARRCVRAGMHRRDAIFMVGSAEPTVATWAAAVEIGAERLCVLPIQEVELVRGLSEAAEAGRIAPRLGRVIAVTAGRGGGGASVFAAALGQCAGESLLVDLDPCGGGLDLLLGVESSAGLRWPDLAIQSGRLSWTAVREVLPQLRGLSVLSGARTFYEIDAGAAASIVDAGRRGGATVICDLPRQLTSSSLRVLGLFEVNRAIPRC